MTNQEVYDRVKAHLLTQNARSATETSFCRYRGPNGMKCAIGALIPDEKYQSNFDDVVGSSSIEHRPDILAACGLEPNQRSLAMYLQEVHDIYPPAVWSLELARVAVTFGLEP